MTASHYVVSVTVQRVDNELAPRSPMTPATGKHERVITELSRVTNKSADLGAAIDYVEAVLELSRGANDSFTDPEPKGNTRDR
jgi:hypothetical protein